MTLAAPSHRTEIAAAKLWRAPPPDEVVWECWGAEYSLFDRRTGDTHIIGLLPAEILRLIGDTPRSAGALAEVLAELCDQENTPEWNARIGNMLSDLETLELAESDTG